MIKVTFLMVFLKAIHCSKREITGKQQFWFWAKQGKSRRYSVEISEECRIFYGMKIISEWFLWKNENYKVHSIKNHIVFSTTDFEGFPIYVMRTPKGQK